MKTDQTGGWAWHTAVAEERSRPGQYLFFTCAVVSPCIKNGRANQEEPGHAYFFNMLGPIITPAFPPFQLIGCTTREMARIYNYRCN